MKKLVHIVFLLYCFNIICFGQQNTQIKNLEIPYIRKNEVVIKHIGYTLSYNEKYEQANWVAYKLTAKETQKIVARSNKFSPDTKIVTGSAVNSDYKSSGYDRGHLAPAADMGWSEQAMRESFFYSNMSPQKPGFNRGIWKRLEEQVRQWAIDNQSIYVVTGPILEANLQTIGNNKVAVPNYYYKVILDYTKPELKGIGFIMPNLSSSQTLKYYAVTIDSIETVTGINFFPALPNEQEKSIENTICLENWSWKATSTQTNKKQYSSKSTVQCEGITKAGNRCKRMTYNSSGKCKQHESK